MVILIMGVAGSGKTTVGTLLASALGWDFADADDFHSAENVRKMASGVPLTDEDRVPGSLTCVPWFRVIPRAAKASSWLVPP